MPLPRRVTTAIAAGVAGAAMLASATAAQAPWALPAQDLSAAGGNAQFPDVAAAPDGTGVAVWIRSNGVNNIAQASLRPPGGVFAPAVDLSAPLQSAIGPRVAIGGDGTAVAVWHRSNGTNSIVQAAVRPPGGTFGAAVDLSATGANASAAAVAVAPDGTATVVWQRANVIQSATRPPGGAFAAPVNVSAPGVDSSAPRIAAGADGSVTAVWLGDNGPNLLVQAATRPPGGAFGGAVDLSLTGQNAASPTVAVGADGTTAAVWQRPDGLSFVIQGTVRPPGGTFASPVALSVSGLNALSPDVAVAPDGTATAVWQRFNGFFTMIQSATRPPGGVFAAAVDVSASGAAAVTPSVAVAQDGTVTAGWDRFDGVNSVAQSATRPPGGAFTPGLTLAVPGQPSTNVKVAAAADGSAVVAWQRNNGVNMIVQAVWTANPPGVRQAPAITGTATVGQTLTCGGALFTGAASVTLAWLRGATQVGTAPSYTVSTADEGRPLTCRATATNPYGSVAATSVPVSVPVPTPASPPPGRPVPLALPKVSGAARTGRVLQCRGARFTGAARTQVQWLRGARAIRNASRTRYSVVRADVGRVISCRVTAIGPGGVTRVVSLGVAVRR